MKKVQFYAESFTVESNKEVEGASAGIQVTGLALPFNEVSRNGVLYNKESVIAASKSMIGAPTYYNHVETDLPLGHVKEFKQGRVNGTEGMIYTIDVDPSEERLINKLRRGDISKVSIQALIDEESVKEREGFTEVSVNSFVELSFVGIPGFPQTTTNTQGLNTAVMVESLRPVSNINKSHKEDIMAEQNEQDNQEEGLTLEKLQESIESLSSKVEAITERLGAFEERLKENNKEQDDSEDEPEDMDKKKAGKEEDDDEEEEGIFDDDEEDDEEEKKKKQRSQAGPKGAKEARSKQAGNSTSQKRTISYEELKGSSPLKNINKR